MLLNERYNNIKYRTMSVGQLERWGIGLATEPPIQAACTRIASRFLTDIIASNIRQANHRDTPWLNNSLDDGWRLDVRFQDTIVVDGNDRKKYEAPSLVSLLKNFRKQSKKRKCCFPPLGNQIDILSSKELENRWRICSKMGKTWICDWEQSE